jgi:hypothetical protein
VQQRSTRATSSLNANDYRLTQWRANVHDQLHRIAAWAAGAAEKVAHRTRFSIWVCFRREGDTLGMVR